MNKKVFVVYDSKAEAYANPFIMQTRGQALRGYIEVCNDQKTELYKYPSDFTLFEIAEYDEQTGTYIMHKTHVNLGLAIQFKNDVFVPAQPIQLYPKENTA